MLYAHLTVQATGTIVVLTLAFGTVLGGKECSEDQYINNNGKCRYCRLCRAGEGMNFTSQVPSNENGDPLKCHPCYPCPPGTYNDPSAGQYACSQCRLNCQLMHRKEYEPCGGTKSGKCGACLNSSYIDTDNNIDSPCYKKDGVEIKGIRLIETNDKALFEHKDGNIDDLKSPTDNSTSAWWIYVIFGSLGGLVVAFGMISLIVLRKHKFPKKPANLISSISGASLVESSTSVGHDNNGVNHKYEKVSLDDIDLESDGPTEGHMPHHELQYLQSSGPEALRRPKSADGDRCVKDRKYPDVVVDVGNVYFNHLAKQLYGHEVPEIFRQLDVRDQTIFAELELYKLDRIKYEDAIYRLLLAWVRLKTTNATLASLCPILEDNGMANLSKELLDIAANNCVNTNEHDKKLTRQSADTCVLFVDNKELRERGRDCQMEDNSVHVHNNSGQTDHFKASDMNTCIQEDNDSSSLTFGDDFSLDSSLESVASINIECEVVERETSL